MPIVVCRLVCTLSLLPALLLVAVAVAECVIDQQWQSQITWCAACSGSLAFSALCCVIMCNVGSG